MNKIHNIKQPRTYFQNNTQEKAKKIIEKHYQEAYEEDMKKHKIGLVMLWSMTIIGLTAFFTSKKDRGTAGIMGFGSLMGLILSPIFKLKPQKEKYEEMMQKELNEVV